MDVKAMQAALDALLASGHSEAAMAIHAALQTQEGRRAAGLPRRGRGSVNNANQVMVHDAVFWVAVQHAAGAVSRDVLVGSALAYLGPNTDHRTVDKFISQLMARAEKAAAGLAAFGVLSQTK